MVVPGMSLRKSILLIALYNAYFLWPMHALNLGESTGWDPRCSCNELNNLGKVFLVVGLQQLPEPLNDVVGGSVTRILHISPQIIH